MFGEAESESPRVPSPWDSLMSQSPSSNSCRSRSAATPSPLATELIPKLVPEADDGNVEYKLQLLNPSPSRFARLVTQLKWRLLEGGGQAYYELGVADSGYLVGLPRTDLEQSLETLEMMAGEIGASVIVVKEIEVPAAMAELAAAQSDVWSRKRSGRSDGEIGEATSGGDSTATSNTEAETETSTTDFETEDDHEDLEKTVVYDKDVPPPFLSIAVSKNDSGGSDSSSGSGTSRAKIFVMDPDDPADVADAEGEIEVTTHGAQHPQFTVDLEISSVYKPRPVRTRAGHHAAMLLHGKHHKRNKGKKYQNYPPPAVGAGWVAGTTHAEGQLSTASSISVELKHGDGHLFEDGNANAPADGHQHENMHHRRWVRDRKREAKRNALLHNAVAIISSGGTDEGEHPEGPWDSSQTISNRHPVRSCKDTKRSQHGLRNGHAITSDATEQLAVGLEDLHVSVAESLAVPVVPPSPQNHPAAAGDSVTEGDWVNVGSKVEQQDDSDRVLVTYEDDDDVFPSPTIPTSIFSPFRSDKVTSTGTGDPPVSYLSAASQVVARHRERTRATEGKKDGSAAGEDDVKLEDENDKDKGETRLIVEALVVRKMSLEEAFLDFGGFSLIN